MPEGRSFGLLLDRRFYSRIGQRSGFGGRGLDSRRLRSCLRGCLDGLDFGLVAGVHGGYGGFTVHLGEDLLYRDTEGLGFGFGRSPEQMFWDVSHDMLLTTVLRFRRLYGPARNARP